MFLNYYWWFVMASILRLLSLVLYVSEGLCDLSLIQPFCPSLFLSPSVLLLWGREVMVSVIIITMLLNCLQQFPQNIQAEPTKI